MRRVGSIKVQSCINGGLPSYLEDNIVVNKALSEYRIFEQQHYLSKV